MHALAKRQRPRDLYHVVHLYRRQDLQPDRAIVRSTQARKCEFKGIPVPTFEALCDRPERTAIGVEWEQMPGHRLRACPPVEAFWQELPAGFDWLDERTIAPFLAAVPVGVFGRVQLDNSWRLPAMVQAWGAEAGSSETICVAAANDSRAARLHQRERRAHRANDRALLCTPHQRWAPVAVRREGRHGRVPQLPA